jgi:hypothetical protein
MPCDSVEATHDRPLGDVAVERDVVARHEKQAPAKVAVESIPVIEKFPEASVRVTVA